MKACLVCLKILRTNEISSYLSRKISLNNFISKIGSPSFIVDGYIFSSFWEKSELNCIYYKKKKYKFLKILFHKKGLF